VIIVDDASKDGTREILDDLRKNGSRKIYELALWLKLPAP
jgi:glycosyltransferase involved in cell wall biosynthesis